MARSALALLAVVLLAGCDVVSATGDGASPTSGAGGQPAAPTARASGAGKAPAGWLSLEGEGSALRLYYQFVDEQHRVRFVETLEEVPEALRASVGFVKMSVPPPLSPRDAARVRAAQVALRGHAPSQRQETRAAEVVLYSATWCGACRKAKKYLAQKGVDYENRDVDDPRWARELLQRTGQRAIPVIEVNGRILTGFSASGYDALIESV